MDDSDPDGTGGQGGEAGPDGATGPDGEASGRSGDPAAGVEDADLPGREPEPAGERDAARPDASARPDWWATNERIREQLELPPYEPPRFRDGVPTYRVTEELEAEYDCTITFRGKNTRFPDDLVVHVDREPVLRVGRHRDQRANTVYEMDSGEFRERLRRALEE